MVLQLKGRLTWAYFSAIIVLHELEVLYLIVRVTSSLCASIQAKRYEVRCLARRDFDAISCYCRI